MPGTYQGQIIIYSNYFAGSAYLVTVILTVFAATATGSPFGSFDTPLADSTVMSSVPFTGWALDDIGIQSVKIYRKERKNLIFIDDATFVEGARPDVLNRYPGYPDSSRAGWGYMMLTNFLPNGGNGSFTFYVIAKDREGNETTLGQKTIIVDNANAVKPFGTIDTPLQGGTASGSGYINFAWALTPPPNMIPIDGSTMWVWVDGYPMGHPVYNRSREDIAVLFPGYSNANGAGGHFRLDTTQFEDGIHTIAWSATDDAGNTDGIGSRYFSIRNLNSSQQASNSQATGTRIPPYLPGIPLDNPGPVRVIKGYHSQQARYIYLASDGVHHISINELERIKINLDNGGDNSPGGLQGLQEEWSGYCLMGNQMGHLPIGSFLDSKKGIFYWQPGPGFVGEYWFVFVIKDREGKLSRKEVKVNLHPAF